MGIIKKPNEIECKQTLTCMIYGQPGIGKTTLACSSPSPVLLDYDGGVNRINGAHQIDTVQITSWEDTEEAVREIKQSGEYRTIVIDTVGKMLAYMEDYIMRTNPRMKKTDGSLSLQGYGVRKAMFKSFIQDVAISGLNIIFVAHDKEEKQGDDLRVRPEVSGSAYTDLMKELDLVGYMMAYGKDRVITFDPDERFYTKNSCNMHGVIKVPEVVDADGRPQGENKFFSIVIENFVRRQIEEKAETAKYAELMSGIVERINAVANAEDANDFIKWIGTVDHIWQSKAKASQLLMAKAAALGLKLNKSTKKYE